MPRRSTLLGDEPTETNHCLHEASGSETFSGRGVGIGYSCGGNSNGRSHGLNDRHGIQRDMAGSSMASWEKRGYGTVWAAVFGDGCFIEGYMYTYYFASGHAGGGISLFFLARRWEIGTGHVGAVGWHSDRKVLCAIEMVDEKLSPLSYWGGMARCVVDAPDGIAIGAHPVFSLRGSSGTSFPSVAGTLTPHCICGDLLAPARLAPFQLSPTLPLCTAQELRKADSAQFGAARTVGNSECGGSRRGWRQLPVSQFLG